MPQLEKRRLNDRYIATRKPAAKGDRDVTPDSDAPGLALVVTETGHKSFVLIARFPPSKNPTRRALGEYSKSFTLENAREKARAWRALIRKGIDPREEERRQLAEAEEHRKAEERRRENTFEKVAESFIKRHVAGQRQAEDSERCIRKELIARWGNRPLDGIARRDVIAMVEEIADRGAPALARNVLGHAKTLFKWAVSRELLEHSPAVMVEAKALLGEKKVRKRILTDRELFAAWRAAGRLGYPFGPMYRLLALTGCRRAEIAAARRAELNPELLQLIRQHDDNDEPVEWSTVRDDIKLLTIPPERFKSDVPHLVPLSDDAMAVIERLPRFDGDHLFSTTFGKKAVSGFSKSKRRLDREMLKTLKALARKAGEDPGKVTLEPWVVHDLRRSVRTQLSALKVDRNVAELIIGHAKRGLDRIYDQHEFLDEMRDGLERWARRLREINRPLPENVVKLKAPAA